MTVLFATTTFIAADRRITWDGEADTMCKVAANRHLVASACGLASAVVRVKQAVRDGAEKAEDLLDCIDEHSMGLVVTKREEIFLIEDGTLWPRHFAAAAGSGADLALGYVAGAHGRRKTHPSPLVVRRALEWVASRRVDCGGGVDIRRVRR